jgi:hypothetical protein
MLIHDARNANSVYVARINVAPVGWVRRCATVVLCQEAPASSVVGILRCWGVVLKERGREEEGRKSQREGTRRE